MVFAYGETELAWLRKKDKRLGEVIDRIGHVDRAVDPDLFSAVIHHIIGPVSYTHLDVYKRQAYCRRTGSAASSAASAARARAAAC